jgi:type IV secretory pathway VirB3-like protein
MAAAEEVERVSGPIPLGATRPPMVPRIGLPFSAAVPIVICMVEIQMSVTGLQGLLYAAAFGAAVWLPLRVWVSFDWYAIEVLMAWCRTAGPAMDNAKWGGSSVSHFPINPRRLAEEVRGIY